MHNVVKWPNVLKTSCGVNTTGFLKYVWTFYNIMHERVKMHVVRFNGLSFLKVFSFKKYIHLFQESVCVSRPPALFWPPTLALFLDPGPGLQFVFTGPGPQFVFTGPGLQFVFIGPGPQFVFTGPCPLCLPQICIYQHNIVRVTLLIHAFFIGTSFFTF